MTKGLHLICTAWVSLGFLTMPLCAQVPAFQLHPWAQAPAARAPETVQYAVTRPVVSSGPLEQRLAGWLRRQVEKLRPAGSSPAARLRGGSPAQMQALADLQARAGGTVEVWLRRENGTPFLIKGGVLEARSVRAPLARESADLLTARRFLNANRHLLRLADPDAELWLTQVQADPLGGRLLRFTQRYRGLEVWPAELAVRLDAAGNVVLLHGAYIPTPEGVADTPTVSPGEAVERARTHLETVAATLSAEPRLVVYGPLAGAPRLAWKFELTGAVYQVWDCVVDALTGEVLLAVNRICHAAATGSGTGADGRTVPLNLWRNGGTYYLMDTSRPMFDPGSAPPNLDNTRGVIAILDAKNTPPTADPQGLDQLVYATSANPNSGWVPDAVSAAYGLGQTYQYYLERHNRNSLDGRGGNIVGIVRFGVNFPNAFWNGKAMFFGDGFTRSVDVTGHELTHGVINNVGEGGILVYHNQPGALNEAMADIFGELVEEFALGGPDWLKGAHLQLPSGPIQNYANPNQVEFAPGRPHPARMGQFVNLPDTAESDNGGVHINSSIINHAFYLLSRGLPDAIGTEKAARIFYRTLTQHLQKQSQFIDMRHGALASAEALFGAGSAEARATAAAFDAVEIFDAPQDPGPAPLPVVQGPDASLSLALIYDEFFDELDGPYLIRRDPTQGDGPNGTILNTLKRLATRRVAVSGDGTFAVYVTEDYDLGFLATDESEVDLLGLPGTIHSVAMSPDGSRYAFVLRDAQGNPTPRITVYDLRSDTARTIDLYVPLQDGERLNIVQFADAMDFFPDGRSLVYDAYSEIRTQDGARLGSWTLFALDINTTTIRMLIDLNEGVDFGNPALGHAHPHLITFEVVPKQTGRSTIVTANLVTGEAREIFTLNVPDELTYPGYTGDDSAIIFTVPDPETWTGYSLARQPLAADGLTPAGNATFWLDDAAVGVVYRRGTFVSSNSPPSVQLTNPAPGQTFSPPANLRLAATATDADGAVARVEFYQGSLLLGTDTTPPFEFAWDNVPAGQYRLIARAIDNLGLAADSAPVHVVVAAAATRPRLVGVRLNAAGRLEFRFEGAAGSRFRVQASPDLKTWTQVGEVVLGPDAPPFTDDAPRTTPRRFYRLVQ
jgi:Zn-dependent metalloprotease